MPHHIIKLVLHKNHQNRKSQYNQYDQYDQYDQYNQVRFWFCFVKEDPQDYNK